MKCFGKTFITILIFFVSVIITTLFSCTTDKEKMLESVEKYTRELYTNPNAYWFYEGRGVTYSGLGEYEKAIGDFQKALSIHKAHHTYYYLGLAFLGNHMVLDALETANTAIKFKAVHEGDYALRGICHDLLGKRDMAIKDYSVYLGTTFSRRFKSEYFILYARRSILYFQSKEYNNALKDAEAAIKIDDSMSDAYYLRFMIYTKLGDLIPALEDLKTALKKGFSDVKSINDFLEANKTIDRKEIDRLVGRYLGGKTGGMQFALNNQDFIIKKFLNIKD